MVTEVMVITIMIIIIGIGVTFSIYLILNCGKREKRKYQRQGKSILVHDGVDVRSQIPGSDRGAYFTGNLEHKETDIVRGRKQLVWQISFKNIDSGQTFRYRFCDHIWIGRTGEHPGETSMLLSDDQLVSRTHCIIYELEEKLCLEDMNSKNCTYMDGIRVNVPIYLKNGCILKVGNTRLEVEFGK